MNFEIIQTPRYRHKGPYSDGHPRLEHERRAPGPRALFAHTDVTRNLTHLLEPTSRQRSRSHYANATSIHNLMSTIQQAAQESV